MKDLKEPFFTECFNFIKFMIKDIRKHKKKKTGKKRIPIPVLKQLTKNDEKCKGNKDRINKIN